MHPENRLLDSDSAEWASYVFRYLEIMDRMTKEDVVLNFRCGEGFGCKMLSSRAKSVIGADIDEEVININSRRYKYDSLTFDQVGTSELPYKKANFSFLVSLDTLDTLENPKDMLLEYGRVCQNGSTLVLTCKNKNSLYPWEKSHNEVNNWSAEQFLELVAPVFNDMELYGQLYVRYVNRSGFKYRFAKWLEKRFYGSFSGFSMKFKDRMMQSLIKKNLYPDITDFKYVTDWDTINTQCGDMLIVCKNA